MTNSYCRKKYINTSEAALQIEDFMHGSIQVSLRCSFTHHKFLYSLQGTPNTPFLKVSFIQVPPLVFHPCLLHEVFEGWFFMTLLSDWGKKKPQFSTISALVLLVLLKEAKDQASQSNTESLFDVRDLNGTEEE